MPQRVGVEETKSQVGGPDWAQEHLRLVAQGGASGQTPVSDEFEGWDDINPDDPGGHLGDK